MDYHLTQCDPEVSVPESTIESMPTIPKSVSPLSRYLTFPDACTTLPAEILKELIHVPVCLQIQIVFRC